MLLLIWYQYATIKQRTNIQIHRMLLLIPSILVILFRFTLNSNTSYVAINRQRKRHFSASAQIQIHRMLLLIKQGGAKSYLKRRIQIHRMLLLIVLFHWININARRIQIHRMLLLIQQNGTIVVFFKRIQIHRMLLLIMI